MAASRLPREPDGKVSDQPMRFRFVHEHQVVVVTSKMVLKTKQDVIDWHERYCDYFRTHFAGKRVDVIFDLTDFHVQGPAMAHFGEYRAKVLNEFHNRSYRFHIDSKLKTVMYTSSVIHGVTSNAFPTFEAAVAALIADRKGGVGAP
jgi:hypothetical protein